MKLLSLTLVRVDDWEGVYNQYGKLVAEDHRINWADLLTTNVCKVVAQYWYSGELEEFGGFFPHNFSALDKEKFE